MLIGIVALPICGSILVMFIRNTQSIKIFSLIIAIITFILSLLIYFGFQESQNSYQYMYFLTINSYITFTLGIDSISIWFVLLTTFLTPFCILASWNNVRESVSGFISFQLLTEAALLGLFSVTDLISFYIMFEAILIPLFLVVGKWGSSVNRIRAALLLFLYTLAGSLFILISIVSIAYFVGTTDISTLRHISIDSTIAGVLFFGFFIALAVKTPMVPFHIWLPRAHVEAPLAGSMFLAGAVLKASTYGFIRILLSICGSGTVIWLSMINVIGAVTVVFSSLSTLRQFDIKSLVAYSSIAHIGVVTLGLFSNTIIGISGAIILSIAHGFVSPGLFLVVGGVIYEQFHTRVIIYYRGLSIRMPITITLFFVLICCNIGTPLSGNWIGELYCLSGILQQSVIISILVFTSIFLSSGYISWIQARISGGSITNYLQVSTDLSRREFIIISILVIITILLGISPNTVTYILHSGISDLLYTQILHIFK